MRSFVPDYEMITRPDLAATLALLAAEPGIWRPFAGGTDLMVLFEAGRLAHKKFVSLWHLDELRGVRIDDEWVELGALTTYAQIARSPELASEFPLLKASAEWTGAPAIQSRGTVGGNIVNASPAADTPPVLLCYDAEVQLVSAARGARWVGLEQFFRGYKKTALAPDELLCSVRFPRAFRHWRQFSRKVGTRNAQAISKLFLATTLRLDGDRVADVRVAVGSLGPHPLRVRAAEDAVRGLRLDAAATRAAGAALSAALAPIDDIRSTAAYRSRVVANLFEDFLAGFVV